MANFFKKTVQYARVYTCSFALNITGSYLEKGQMVVFNAINLTWNFS